jgi:hypothetical protein
MLIKLVKSAPQMGSAPSIIPEVRPTASVAPITATPLPIQVAGMRTTPVSLAEQGGVGVPIGGMEPAIAARTEPREVESADGPYHVGNWVLRKSGLNLSIELGSVPGDAQKLPSGGAITLAGKSGLLHISAVSEDRQQHPIMESTPVVTASDPGAIVIQTGEGGVAAPTTTTQTGEEGVEGNGTDDGAPA